jgi:hypothetical protein
VTSPPLVSRALGARAATRAAPVVALLVGLFFAGAEARVVAVCASLAASTAASAFAERFVVARGWGRPWSWRRAAEASLASAFLHSAAIVNAVWWLYTPAAAPAVRLDAALQGHPERELALVLICSWTLASPAGLLVRNELERWPLPRGTWRDDGGMARWWFTTWAVPPGLLIVGLCAAGDDRPLQRLGQGGGLALVNWFFLFVLGTFGTIVLAAIDDLAWRLASEAPPIDAPGEPQP